MKTVRRISIEVCVLLARAGVSDDQPVNINDGTGIYDLLLIFAMRRSEIFNTSIIM